MNRGLLPQGSLQGQAKVLLVAGKATGLDSLGRGRPYRLLQQLLQ